MIEQSRPLALVTGASSGIGVALARELARDGFDLVLVARRVAPMEALAAELGTSGARARIIPCDLVQPTAVAELVEALASSPLDVVINNAGVGYSVPFAAAAEARLQALVQLNVVATTALARGLLPRMIERGRGRMMFVASLGAYLPGPGAAAYHASKAYVLSLGEAIAYELRGTGVTATVLCPGPTTTGYWEGADATHARLGKGSLTIPVMRAEEVARIGYRAMTKGRPVVVAGRRNAFSALTLPLVPRRLVLAMSARLNTDQKDAR